MKPEDQSWFRALRPAWGGLLMLLCLGSACSSWKSAPAPHEYASLQPATLAFTNWSFPAFDSKVDVDLEAWLHEPETECVWLIYFAPWCPNWNYQAPAVQRLYRRYRDAGLRVIAISEYGSRRQLRRWIRRHEPEYPIVMESDHRKMRTSTPHFHYRTQTGDTRKWGSPWNLFLSAPAKDDAAAVPAYDLWVANGEIIETEVETFLQRRLRVNRDRLP